jgi:hypothetical protein
MRDLILVIEGELTSHHPTPQIKLYIIIPLCPFPHLILRYED